MSCELKNILWSGKNLREETQMRKVHLLYEFSYDIQERCVEHDWTKLNYPEDANLIDVIEMLCYCVAAGMTKPGNVYDITISDTVLQKAVQNTIELLEEYVTVEDEEGKMDADEI